jgi:F420-dependent oxidoreductase-like protein
VTGRPLRIGLGVGTFGGLLGRDDVVDMAREAERLGFESFWIGEAYGTDAVSALGASAAVTQEMLLGSAVLAMPGRSAAMTAQSAMTLDAMTGGRFLLGLGTSGPQVAEGWHGVRFTRPVTWTREYVDVIRMVLRGERVTYEGSIIRLPLPDGPGKSLASISTPLRPEIPVYLGALGPRNLALVGQIADGWLPLWFAPEHAPRLTQPILEAAVGAERTPDEILVSPMVVFRVDDDLDAARAPARIGLALYIGGMGSREQNFYHRLISGYGYGELCRRVQDLYLDGKHAQAAATIPDELVDLLCLCGPPARIAQRLEAYRGIADRVIALPAANSAKDRLAQMGLFAAAARLRSRETEIWIYGPPAPLLNGQR